MPASLIACAIAVVCGYGGLLLSYHFGLPSGPAIVLDDPARVARLMHGPAGGDVSPADVAWLAWLLWQGGAARVQADAGRWRIEPAEPAARAADWLAATIERFGPLPA